jgi:hypothetical protein
MRGDKDMEEKMVLKFLPPTNWRPLVESAKRSLPALIQAVLGDGQLDRFRNLESLWESDPSYVSDQMGTWAESLWPGVKEAHAEARKQSAVSDKIVEDIRKLDIEISNTVNLNGAVPANLLERRCELFFQQGQLFEKLKLSRRLTDVNADYVERLTTPNGLALVTALFEFAITLSKSCTTMYNEYVSWSRADRAKRAEDIKTLHRLAKE